MINFTKRLFADEEYGNGKIVTLIDCDGDDTDNPAEAVVIIVELDDGGFLITKNEGFTPVRKVN